MTIRFRRWSTKCDRDSNNNSTFDSDKREEEESSSWRESQRSIWWVRDNETIANEHSETQVLISRDAITDEQTSWVNVRTHEVMIRNERIDKRIAIDKREKRIMIVSTFAKLWSNEERSQDIDSIPNKVRVEINNCANKLMRSKSNVKWKKDDRVRDSFRNKFDSKSCSGNKFTDPRKKFDRREVKNGIAMQRIDFCSG